MKISETRPQKANTTAEAADEDGIAVKYDGPIAADDGRYEKLRPHEKRSSVVGVVGGGGRGFRDHFAFGPDLRGISPAHVAW